MDSLMVTPVDNDPRANSSLDDANAVSVAIDVLPIGAAVPCSIFLKVAGRFVLFRNPGERVTQKRYMELSGKGVSHFYLHEAMWKRFGEFLEQSSPPDSEPKEQATRMRQVFLVYAQELERKNREMRRQMFDKMHKHALKIAELIRRRPGVASEMLSKNPAPEAQFAVHAMNTAVYAGVIGVKLGYSVEELRNLIFAAMVHDAGKLVMDKKLLQLTAEPTAEERAARQLHTRLGAELLQTFVSSPGAVSTALQHHERMDGNGYPSKLKGEEIHAFARIVAIADEFDRLTAGRPGQDKVTPQEAIWKMAAEVGRFDPKFLSAIPVAPAEPKN